MNVARPLPDRARRSIPRFARTLAYLATGIACAIAIGCASGDSPLDVIDPEAVPAEPTWDQANAILQLECAPCHRAGDEEQDFESCAGIRRNLSGISDTALDGNSMPPGAWPRLTSEQKLLLRRWISQGAVSPCN
ncbi:MAG: hypothetical protein R3B81_14105 [bacterium]